MLEIRHKGWNDPDILARLTEAGVGFCNIGQPRLGKSLTGTQYATSAVGSVRLHGRNYHGRNYEDLFQGENMNDRYNYLYKREELKKWAENIERVSQAEVFTDGNSSQSAGDVGSKIPRKHRRLLSSETSGTGFRRKQNR